MQRQTLVPHFESRMGQTVLCHWPKTTSNSRDAPPFGCTNPDSRLALDCLVRNSHTTNLRNLTLSRVQSIHDFFVFSTNLTAQLCRHNTDDKHAYLRRYFLWTENLPWQGTTFSFGLNPYPWLDGLHENDTQPTTAGPSSIFRPRDECVEADERFNMRGARTAFTANLSLAKRTKACRPRCVSKPVET